jgi:hypothetical protein
VISPIKPQIIYSQPKFSSTRLNQQGTPKRKVSYGHALGTSSLFGLSAFGFSTLFIRGWKAPFIVGMGVTGLMMLLNIPEKLYQRK